ncbi:MAG: putative toxin-antitoxin system toxin component, PIN family [Bacteroidales bacterium]|jgi:putative toxin-antitoxin system toxin component, PIN family|nr:putative toxin-antitoxin system toxin component, PIN family [Bacteroidales bacterium]
MIYAVIDTNVLVSSLLSRTIDTGTVLIRKHILDGTIVPVFNEEIFQEYEEVLHRAKFNLPAEAIDAILDAIAELGVTRGRTPTTENFPDPKDIVFYEVALSKEDSYLVTGNTKHFPKNPIVVTPAELLTIIERQNCSSQEDI